MSATRRPKRFLRFLSLFEMIVKRFTVPMTCSAGTRSLEIARLFHLSSLFKGCFLLRVFAQDGVAVQFLQTHGAGVGDGFGVGMEPDP
jgi:hypothetical protein